LKIQFIPNSEHTLDYKANSLMPFSIGSAAYRQHYAKDTNPLKTKRKLLYLKTQFVPRSKHFSSQLWKPISLWCKRHKLLFVLR